MTTTDGHATTQRDTRARPRQRTGPTPTTRTAISGTGMSNTNANANDHRKEQPTDQSPFQACDRCGTIVVAGQLPSHTCPDQRADHDDTRAEVRQAMRDQDQRDPDATVLYLRGRSNSAYHVARPVFDLDDMTISYEPACRAAPRRSDRGYRPATRCEAKRANRYPCGHCHEVGRRGCD